LVSIYIFLRIELRI